MKRSGRSPPRSRSSPRFEALSMHRARSWPRSGGRPRPEQAEIDTARRRVVDAERSLAEESAQVAEVVARRVELEAELEAARSSVTASQVAEGAIAERREAARAAASVAAAARAAADERVVGAGAALASVRGRLDALRARLAEEESRGIARAARKVGGRRLDDDLDVDPSFRAAVETALADAGRAYVVGSESVPALAGERGTLVVAERTAGAPGADDPRERRFREQLIAAGGGTLDVAIRRDPNGAARRLLARAAWLPDLAACLSVQGGLPPGWVAVPRDGGVVVSDLAVALGAPESVIERRADIVRLSAQVEALETELAAARDAAAHAAREADLAASAIEAARSDEIRSSGARRAAEEAERLAARRARDSRRGKRPGTRRKRGGSPSTSSKRGRRSQPSRPHRVMAERRRPSNPARLPTRRQRHPTVRGSSRGSRGRPSFGHVEIALRRISPNETPRGGMPNTFGLVPRPRSPCSEDRLARAERELAALVDRERALDEERATLGDEVAVARRPGGWPRARHSPRSGPPMQPIASASAGPTPLRPPRVSGCASPTSACARPIMPSWRPGWGWTRYARV